MAHYIYYVENTFSDEKPEQFTSLKKAVERTIELASAEFNPVWAKHFDKWLISLPCYNLEYYHRGDTFETLYERCKKTFNELKRKYG